ncbi:hypothetical protein [Nocardiopsis lambiniae]|uniref:Uncharacterized protein n=1 Tax=Nocardiopsis lambiniae TaxID=3075539 RepID=A0ABU2MFF2_9ACTN|nr:hypothetical protein [Nocardiopsis sp. DSM 44743]MDT0331425.1 hypothetical protein [Nocardiopsis sp. DSM 44743]
MPAAPEPVFPDDAMGATQHIHAVPAMGRGDSRPMFRDEVPEDAGADTAQFDVRAVNDYDGYEDDGYDDYDDGYDGSRAKRRKALMIGGFVAATVIAAGGMFFLASGGLGSDGEGNATTVATEEDDPGALSVENLFPETLEVDGHGSFTRVAVNDEEDCSVGAHGDYGTVLADNGCRQLIRASYLSEDEGRAVTIGIAAMSDEDNAATALDAQKLEDSQWFAGLAGDEGTPAERLGYAGGHGSGGQWGRYLLFSLATNSDGGQEDADGLAPVSEGFLEEAYERLSEDRG